jgi:hypothetical protein
LQANCKKDKKDVTVSKFFHAMRVFLSSAPTIQRMEMHPGSSAHSEHIVQAKNMTVVTNSAHEGEGERETPVAVQRANPKSGSEKNRTFPTFEGFNFFAHRAHIDCTIRLKSHE